MYTRIELQRLILEGGGTVVSNPTEQTSCVVAGCWTVTGSKEMDIRTKALIAGAL
jgi:BRCA1 C Terminus (BRCT) domain